MLCSPLSLYTGAEIAYAVIQLKHKVLSLIELLHSLSLFTYLKIHD
jgi:hypothetical protein